MIIASTVDFIAMGIGKACNAHVEILSKLAIELEKAMTGIYETTNLLMGKLRSKATDMQ